MEEEKPKVIIIGNVSTKNFGVTDMQVYRNFETDEVTSSLPLNRVFTIENYRTDFEYLSGREKRRQRRKQQRKKEYTDIISQIHNNTEGKYDYIYSIRNRNNISLNWRR